jgi:hypothetical protein
MYSETQERCQRDWQTKQLLGPRIDKPETTTEQWYEIEYSRIGADDWCAESDTADTLESARRIHAQRKVVDFEFRIVKKTLSTEVIEDLP